MKKTVKVSFLLLSLLLLLSTTVVAFSVESDPASITTDVAVGQCHVEPLTMIVSDDARADFEFSVSKELMNYVHVTKLDASHFIVYFHPTPELAGQSLNGLLYVNAESTEASRIMPLAKATIPIELTMNVKGRQDVFDSTCPQLGEEVEVVPLSLDAISLLLLVLVSLGIVNVSTRLKTKKGTKQVAKKAVKKQWRK